MTSEPQLRNHAGLVWSVADKLRGVYKQSEYGRVILPLSRRSIRRGRGSPGSTRRRRTRSATSSPT